MSDKPTRTFDAAGLLQLFPTFLWRAQLRPAEFQSLNGLVLRHLASAGAPLSGLRPGENWQSGHDLHEQESSGQLKEWILAGAAGALDHLRIAHQGVAITGCWANINPPGTGHRLHSHRNNYLSGAYYIQVQEGADTINFFDPKPQAGVIRPPVLEPTAENTELAVIKVEEGTLLLFPAWLQHSVNANQSSRPRISISFNLMFANFAELMSRPAWTPGKGNA